MLYNYINYINIIIITIENTYLPILNVKIKNIGKLNWNLLVSCLMQLFISQYSAAFQI